MKKLLWIFIAFSGFISVLMGAAGAHWLVSILEPEDISRIEKAATYQIYHTLALLVLAISSELKDIFKIKWSAIFFIIGIILFSGSLYVYSFTHIKTLVYITPLGGLSFMLGWLSLFFIRSKK